VLHAAGILRPIAPIINPKARNKSAKTAEQVSRRSAYPDINYGVNDRRDEKTGAAAIKFPPAKRNFAGPLFVDNDLSAVLLWYITIAWNY